MFGLELMILILFAAIGAVLINNLFVSRGGRPQITVKAKAAQKVNGLTPRMITFDRFVIPEGWKVDFIKVKFPFTLGEGDALVQGETFQHMVKRYSFFSSKAGVTTRVIYGERDSLSGMAKSSCLKSQTLPYVIADLTTKVFKELSVDPDFTQPWYKIFGPFPGGVWSGQVELENVNDAISGATAFECDAVLTLTCSPDDHNEELIKISEKKVSAANLVDIMGSIYPYVVCDMSKLDNYEIEGRGFTQTEQDQDMEQWNEYNDDLPTDPFQTGDLMLFNQGVHDYRFNFTESVTVLVYNFRSVLQPGGETLNYDAKYAQSDKADSYEIDPTGGKAY